MKKLTCFVLLLTAFVAAPAARAQYFKFDTATNDTEIREDVDAILKFFNSLVGGGMFHTADLHSVAGLDIGLRGVVAKVPDKFKNLPVFSQENYLGLAFLHASFGLPGNLELFGRFFYFPIGSDQDLSATPPRADSRGGITLIGGGLRYGLLQLPALPKVMVMGAYHAVLVPDEFDFGTVSTVSFKGVVSQSLPLLTIYAGGGVDITSLKLSDQFLGGDRFNKADPHLTIGAEIKPFPLVHVEAAYNIREFNSFDLGLGLSFR
ncbi:MAG: hypothetical protein D6743_05985 [Calditrichaeota bacterium]|nr:MAG: hypothetical protein D6743_05985 [Calditrichota bacterium]